MATHESLGNASFHDVRSKPDPFGFLSALVDPINPFFEEEWIDFKGEPKDDKNGREIWSKALSGFANTTDGVIVWGIDARKTGPNDIDAACGLRLVSNPGVFEGRLREWRRSANNPPVAGVDFQCYPGPSGDGFVVCLVPESGHKPHRAEFAGKCYYYRAGDEFKQAEPAMLRHLFYPRYNSDFKIEVCLEYSEANPDYRPVAKLTLKASIQNVGNATANDVYVRVDTTSRVKSKAWVIPENEFWSSPGGNPSSGMIVARYPLHPDMRTAMWTSVPWDAQIRSEIVSWPPAFADFSVECHVYCSDSSSTVTVFLQLLDFQRVTFCGQSHTYWSQPTICQQVTALASSKRLQ